MGIFLVLFFFAYLQSWLFSNFPFIFCFILNRRQAVPVGQVALADVGSKNCNATLSSFLLRPPVKLNPVVLTAVSKVNFSSIHRSIVPLSSSIFLFHSFHYFPFCSLFLFHFSLQHPTSNMVLPQMCEAKDSKVGFSAGIFDVSESSNVMKFLFSLKSY